MYSRIRTWAVLGLVFCAAISVAYAAGQRSGGEGAEPTKGTIGLVCTNQHGVSFRWDDTANVQFFQECIADALQSANADMEPLAQGFQYYIQGYEQVEQIGQFLRQRRLNMVNSGT